MRIEHGKDLAGAGSTVDGVRARFVDGSVVEADLLIGADGIRSTVRRMIDPAAPKPTYVGFLNTGGYARGVEVPANPGDDHLVFGRKPSCGYVKDPTGEVWWFAHPPARTEPDPETLAAIPASRWREQLTELFTEDSTAALQVIGHTERIFSGWITYDMPTVPSWHNDRMIIIGDAAHAVSPSAGQGASVAIEDAVVLAECLRDLPDVPRAFAHYEQLRRDRVQRIVAQGRHNGGGKTVGPVGRVLRDAIMPFAVRIMFRGGRDPFAWMWNHHIDWDAPIEGERPVRSYDVGSSWPSPQG